MAFIRPLFPRSGTAAVAESVSKILSGRGGATVWSQPRARRYSLPVKGDVTVNNLLVNGGMNFQNNSREFRQSSTATAIKSSIQDPDNIKCGSKKHDVTLEDLTSLLGMSPLTLRLIDVREPKEIEDTGSIPTSINVPLSKLKAALQVDPAEFETTYGGSRPNKDDLVHQVIFYGLGAVKSQAALEIAHKLGFKKARHYPGGWEEWSTTHPPKV